MPTAVVFTLSASERHRLKKLSRSRTMPHQLVVRATIVRLAAAGLANARIAARLGLKVDTVRKWRGRFAADRIEGLKDLPRSGRPPTFTALQRAEVKALACQLPATHGLPLFEVELHRAGHRSHQSRHRRDDLGLHGAADPSRRCDQAVAAPIVDHDARL